MLYILFHHLILSTSADKYVPLLFQYSIISSMLSLAAIIDYYNLLYLSKVFFRFWNFPILLIDPGTIFVLA